jgi:hypothetical protein
MGPLKQYRIKNTFVGYFGYPDHKSDLMGERILNTLSQFDFRFETPYLKKGDVLTYMDVLYSKEDKELYTRFCTQDGVFVCVRYQDTDNYLEMI